MNIVHVVMTMHVVMNMHVVFAPPPLDAEVMLYSGSSCMHP